LDFHTECWNVAQNVLRALSIGLGLKDEEFLLKFHQQKENELSLRHYPPVDEESIRNGKLDRLGAHTDVDSFTLLWQDEVGGLEVKDKGGKWVDVQAVEGALVMNIGDVLQRWSNGMLHSSVRWNTTDGEQIISLPHFIEYIFHLWITATIAKMESVKRYHDFRFHIL
jgi:isopenicillin N synthase-like dioxygenase